MKLVDILARELEEWPEFCVEALQNFKEDSRLVFFYCTDGSNEYDRYFSERAEDATSEDRAPVTRDAWQAARAAYLASIQPARDPEIAAVVEKPANPWRRNRGRTTPPVPVGTRVDVKYRNGTENYGVMAGVASGDGGSNPFLTAYFWGNSGERSDIMQWRYAEPQQAQGKPMAQTIEQVIENAEAAAAKAFDPIALRDEYKRITAEGAELSQKMAKLNERIEEIEAALRAEGFAMVEPE